MPYLDDLKCKGCGNGEGAGSCYNNNNGYGEG